MRRYANESKWSNLYSSLRLQAENNDDIIFAQIPNDISEEEIAEVIQELRSLYNFKDYLISRENLNIRGIKNVSR